MFRFMMLFGGAKRANNDKRDLVVSTASVFDELPAGFSLEEKFTSGCRFDGPVVQLSADFLCFWAKLWRTPKIQDSILIKIIAKGILHESN